MLRKSLIIGAIFAVVSTTAMANTLSDENAARDLVTKMMEKIASGEIVAAFDLAKPYALINEKDIENAALQTKSVREKNSQRYGSPSGFEFVDSKTIANSFLRLRFIEKNDRHAFSWFFYFYKTKEGWILNTLDCTDDSKVLFA